MSAVLPSPGNQFVIFGGGGTQVGVGVGVGVGVPAGPGGRKRAAPVRDWLGAPVIGTKADDAPAVVNGARTMTDGRLES